MGSELRTEITAVALRHEGRGRAPDLPGDALRVGGGVATAVASENAPARVVVVRDPSALGAMLRLLGRSGVSYSGSLSLMPSVSTNGGTVSQARLASGDALRFLWPQASSSSGRNLPLELFQASHDFARPDGSVAWLLTHVVDPRASTDPPRLADAVAVAGLPAPGGHGRRAVLLILGGEKADPSQCEAATVVSYLRAVRVPLLVWRLERNRPGGASSAWRGRRDFERWVAIGSDFEPGARARGSSWFGSRAHGRRRRSSLRRTHALGLAVRRRATVSSGRAERRLLDRAFTTHPPSRGRLLSPAYRAGERSRLSAARALWRATGVRDRNLLPARERRRFAPTACAPTRCGITTPAARCHPCHFPWRSCVRSASEAISSGDALQAQSPRAIGSG